MTVVGVLLAGGASSRFGAEKAVAKRGTGLLVDGPLQALIGACDDVAVSAQSDSGVARLARAGGYTVLADPPGAPRGPLAGVLAGLRWARSQKATWMATAPCDTPLLSVDHMAALISAVEANGAAVAMSSNGIEPLTAVWPVEAGLAALEPILASGHHPPVGKLLAGLGAAPVGGFNPTNINTPTDLEGHEDDDGIAGEHSRLFAFEEDFVRTLRCVPMCVRFKLDRTGIKLSLRQWSRFTLADREQLRRASCEAGQEVADCKELLTNLVRLRSGEEPSLLSAPQDQVWMEQTVPAEVLAFASPRGLTPPTDLGWSRLKRLERYALVKLSRDKHENANFEPAMCEFGLPTGVDT